MSRIGIAGLAWLFVSPAFAEAPLPLALEWRAPAECPSGEAVRAELAQIAEVREGFTLQPLVARVEVKRREGAYVALLHTEHEGRSGQRQLTAASCGTLVRSVTLVLALAFGAGVEVREENGAVGTARGSGIAPPEDSPQPASAESEPQRERTTPSEPAALAPRTTNPAPTTRAEPTDLHFAGPMPDATDDAATKLRLSLWLGAGVQFALLPSAALAAGLGADWHTDRYSLGVRALLWPGATHTVRTAEREVDARYSALGATLRGCALFPFGSIGLAACAAFEAAAIRGTTADAARLRGDSATAPWYAAAAGVAFDFPNRSRLRARLEASLALSLNRPRFAIEDLASAYRVPRWSPLLAAGAVFTP